MDAKLGDTVGHRLYVAEKTSFKPLDPRDHNATNGGVCHMVEPSCELRKCLHAQHGVNVIERLHSVKPAWPSRAEPSRAAGNEIPIQYLFLNHTAALGNSNKGHCYGTVLSDADRDALLAFLKTL